MPLRLFDVRDTEAFCWRIVRSSNPDLNHHDAEDLCAFLVASAWEISLTFDPSKGVWFSRYARTRLRNKTVDWVRKEKGRTKWTFSGGRVYERKRPQFVSFDDELVSSLRALGSDPEDGGDPDFRRPVSERSRRRSRDLECLGLEEDARAQGRARAPKRLGDSEVAPR
jgi:DNA-directed RNA polymerase specialized sigma24 family protein